MKKISTTVILVLCLLFVNSSFGQDDKDEKHVVPKEVLLTTLNNVSKMKKLPNDTVLKLMEYNKGYADQVYEILDKSSTDGYMKDAFKKLSDENENSLIGIFGKKGIYNDYVKLMQKQLDPLIKKNNNLKYLY